MPVHQRDEWLKANWLMLIAGALDARYIVFVGKCSTCTSLAPQYA